MIRSMTGFGRASFEVSGLPFDVEVRSVNHRYLDVRVRLPRLFSALEAEVRARVQQRLGRGKVDLSVAAPAGGGPTPRVEVDLAAASQYLAAAQRLAETHALAGAPDVSSLLALPGVARFVEPELPAQDAERELCAAVDRALGALEAMRETEGAAIERDLSERLARVDALAAALEARAHEVQKSVRERLRRRAEQLRQETGLLDEARLHQEIVLAADRLDASEEIQRLRSHVGQFREILAAGRDRAPVGRRLDFLLQEFAREANTIGSKGSDAPIAHQVVELKTEIEKLREQVQNVE